MSISWVGQGAGIALAENAVAIAGDDAISPIANGSGNDSQQGRCDSPRSAYQA